MTKKQIKLNELIEQLQHDINNEEITDIDVIKMKIFELWYFNKYNKEYWK